MSEKPVAVITGGTRGLGRETASLFLQKGYRVAVVARKKEGDQPEIEDRIAIQADVADFEALEKAGGEIASRWNRMDVWINNAGMGKKLSFLGRDEKEWEEVFKINFQGTVNGCRVALSNMLQHDRGGSIINISSLAGLMACPGHSAYCVSKAAVLALTRSLAVEYAARRIRVNAIAPGPLDTAGFRAAGGNPSERARSIPTGTMIEPSEVAQACLFLAGPLPSLTGQTLVMDGGSQAVGCYAVSIPPPEASG